MRKSRLKKENTVEFNHKLYLTGEYNAYHVQDMTKALDIVSFRYNNVIGWCHDENMAFCYTPSVVVMQKKKPTVWVNVVRNKNGIIFSRVTNTPDTKSQSGNVIIKQYKLELKD
jgi:hypothetical protein